MNVQQKKQLDRYSMMIVSKYFRYIGDFLKLVRICKKFEEIPAMFHYNPVKLHKKTQMFPNIETYHVYHKNEKNIEGYDKYVYWCVMSYETYLKKKENEEFKRVIFSSSDWRKYKSFKGANILDNNSLTYERSTEIDLTGITKLECSCFNGNRHIKHVKLDKRIMAIPSECFGGCESLVELDLSYVKILGKSCFNRCSSLTALTLPELLYEIGKNCFYGISELEKIETKGIKLIETNMNYSLYKSFKRNGIDVKGDILYNKNDRIKYGNEIPGEISTIGQGCFYFITTLTDVTLPKSVTKLESECFNGCLLKSIDLSNVVENKCTFSSCNQLTSITLNKNIIKSSQNNYDSFYNYIKSLQNIELSDTTHIPIVSNHLRKLMNEKGYQYDKCIYTQQDRNETDSIIPDEVNIIGGYVFYNSNNIKSITVPSNVTKILSCNFYLMNELERIEIQSTNIQCDSGCFTGLQNIKELDLRAINSFGSNCLCNCRYLTKLTIQNIPIGNGINNCNSLKEIEIIGAENDEYEHPINYKLANLFETNGIHCKRKVFFGYESTSNEEKYCIPDGVNEIATYAFRYCSLKEITIPSSVTLIQSYSFYYCYNNLTHLLIEGNPKIEKNAIYGCSQLIQHQPELKQYS